MISHLHVNVMHSKRCAIGDMYRPGSECKLVPTLPIRGQCMGYMFADTYVGTARNLE